MTSPIPSPGPPPAWYPDPAGSGGLRYWDGLGWTMHVTPHPGFAATAPAPAPPPARPGRRLWPLAAAIAAVFLVGAVAAVAMLVPRAARAAGRFSDDAARGNARSGFEAAQVVRRAEGSYAGATPERLGFLQPDITFTNGASDEFQTASVHTTGLDFTIAVRSLSGRCYVVVDRDGVERSGTLPSGAPCTAQLSMLGLTPEDF